MSVTADDLTFVARDRVERVAPLGVRFWDAVGQRFIGDGLVVSYSAPKSGVARTAVVNHVFTYVLVDLPGLHDVEAGVGEALSAARAQDGNPDDWIGSPDYWAIAVTLGRRYTIAVDDLQGRFLPFSFEADLPFSGLFDDFCGSPPNALVGALPLFSAPARATPPGATAVRAQLKDAATGRPAAWALLEVRTPGGGFVRGLADARGIVVVFVPYPEPLDSMASPLGGGHPLAEQRWPLEISCFYDGSQGPTVRPDLCSLLAQPPAALDLDAAAELAYGRELVLRSAGGSDVLITQAGSPP